MLGLILNTRIINPKINVIKPRIINPRINILKPKINIISHMIENMINIINSMIIKTNINKTYYFNIVNLDIKS